MRMERCLEFGAPQRLRLRRLHLKKARFSSHSPGLHFTAYTWFPGIKLKVCVSIQAKWTQGAIIRLEFCYPASKSALACKSFVEELGAPFAFQDARED